jgi:serine/threonine protein kinase/tetratricopeptide (TPR) repeat protein
MDSQHRQKAEQFYLSALRRPADHRGAFLSEACAGDEELRREIESLLGQQTSGDDVLTRPTQNLSGGSTPIQFPARDGLTPPRIDPFSPGSLLTERFRIRREVGSGGMGVVYEAMDEKLDRRVALKCARPGYRDRLPPEVRAARDVSHFNVCKVHDLHLAPTSQGEVEFVSMEFVDGQTLSDRISREGPVPEAEAREIARQICAGLAQAHRQGVVHGDLKVGNIILSRSSEGGIRAVITDFGLAKMKPLADAQTTGGQGGTPDYMAPELLLGKRSTVASDLYALGILFHFMLTGHSPRRLPKPCAATAQKSREADSQASTIPLGPVIVDAHWRRLVEDLPSPWRKIVARCLEPSPESRYSSAEEILTALEPRRFSLKLGAAAAVTAILALGYWQWGAQPAGPPVRLAVLPFSVHGDSIEGAAGMGLDVADRLSGSRRNFNVISPREAERNRVDTPQGAKAVLGATHALETTLLRSGENITVTASLKDLATGLTMGEVLNGTYKFADKPILAKAIIATVTGAFRLRAGVPKESVSGPAYSYYIQGIDLLRQDAHDADKAMSYLNRAIELDPQSALPFAALADAQIQKFREGGGPKWLDLAATNVARARSINPDSVPVLLVSGSFQQEHGSYERAIKEFTRAAELDANNPQTWSRLAGAYDKASRTDEAIATYRRAIEAEPNYYANYIELGNLYWYRSQFREAEDLYRRVTKIAPNLPTGHMNLGLALIEEGRFPEAEESLLHALHLRKSSDLLMNIGGMYYAQERYTEAAPFFEESVASGPASAIRYRDLGDVYRHLGKNQDAVKAYRSAADVAQDELTRNPRQADSRILLALVSAFLGDSRRAQAEASQALAMEPDNAIVLREAAITYEALNKREDTLRLLRNAPRHLLEELSRQPDVKGLQNDPHFQELLQSQTTR